MSKFIRITLEEGGRGKDSNEDEADFYKIDKNAVRLINIDLVRWISIRDDRIFFQYETGWILIMAEEEDFRSRLLSLLSVVIVGHTDNKR